MHQIALVTPNFLSRIIIVLAVILLIHVSLSIVYTQLTRELVLICGVISNDVVKKWEDFGRKIEYLLKQQTATGKLSSMLRTHEAEGTEVYITLHHQRSVFYCI